MDILVLVLILIVLFGGGGWVYTSSPGYGGPAVGGWLGLVLFVALLVLILRLLGVVS